MIWLWSLITYLLFARRLDELHTAKEAQANLLGTAIEQPIFSKAQQHLRWSRFKDFESEKMFLVFRDEVFLRLLQFSAC